MPRKKDTQKDEMKDTNASATDATQQEVNEKVKLKLNKELLADKSGPQPASSSSSRKRGPMSRPATNRAMDSRPHPEPVKRRGNNDPVAVSSHAKREIPSLPTKKDILTFIQASTDNIGRREIARAFNIKGADRIELKRILKELAADGLIDDTRRRMRKDAMPSVTVVVGENGGPQRRSDRGTAHLG